MYTELPYTLLIEGVLQLVIAVILFITVARRGKNRIMSALAWFFVAIGIFSLGPFLPDVFKVIPGLAILVAYSSVVCHTSVFFGMAGYCSAQFGFLKGSKLMKGVLAVGLLIATAMVVFHVLSLDTTNVSAATRATFKVVSSTSMFFFFIASLVFLTAIFLMLAWQVRREKAALNYAATTGIGLVLLLAALTIRKALDTMAPNLLVDALSFVSLVLVVVGATFQTSVSMSPGIVYDIKTKKPVAKATVRIVRVKDNKPLESRNTKEDGRFGLLIEPGQYYLSVTAPGYAEYKGAQISVEKPTLLGSDVSLNPTAV